MLSNYQRSIYRYNTHLPPLIWWLVDDLNFTAVCLTFSFLAVVGFLGEVVICSTLNLIRFVLLFKTSLYQEKLPGLRMMKHSFQYCVLNKHFLGHVLPIK